MITSWTHPDPIGRRQAWVLACALFGWLATAGSLWAIDLPALTTQAAKPEAEAQTMSASVNALMVYGEDKFQMKSQKVVTVLTKNINDPVASLLEMPLATALSFSPGEAVFRQSLGAGTRLHSTQVLRPLVLSRIPSAPFLRFETGAAEKKPTAWSFKVFSGENGPVVYQRQGSAAERPALLTWDGRDGGRNPVLEPGQRYAWEFAEFNAAGNKIKVRKSGFQVAAAVFDQGRERRVMIAAPRLFKANSHAELTGVAKDLLDETANYFREGGSDRLELRVYAETPEAASGQGQALARYMAKLLLLAPERIRVSSEPLARGGNPRTEIRFARTR